MKPRDILRAGPAFADLIISVTGTPGAKAALVNCRFIEGFAWLEAGYVHPKLEGARPPLEYSA